MLEHAPHACMHMCIQLTRACTGDGRENLQVLEDRSELLREQAQTFQRTARATAREMKRQDSKMCRICCVVVLVAIVAVGAPFLTMHRKEISEFLSSMFPPEDYFDVNETTASEPGSGDFYGSGDLNGTVEPPEPNTDFIQDLWNWRWPWE